MVEMAVAEKVAVMVVAEKVVARRGDDGEGSGFRDVERAEARVEGVMEVELEEGWGGGGGGGRNGAGVIGGGEGGG